MRRIDLIIKTVFIAAVLTVLSCSACFAATVEFDNLRTLIEQGSSGLDSLNSNLSNIQYQLDSLEVAKFNIQGLQDDAKIQGNTEAEKAYEMTAKQLSQQISRLKKSYSSSTEGSRSTLESTLNRLEKSAQSMFISYHQMLANQESAQKSYDAAVANYNTTLNKYTAGLEGESDVASAGNTVLMKSNLLESYNQQVSSMRFSLLSALGIADDGSVTIGTVPDPDINAIVSINKEADLPTFVGYDSNVTSARHLKATNRNKEAAETEADGKAMAEYEDMYHQLQADLLTFQSKQQALTAAQEQYQKLQHQQQAGMLTDTDYKSGEAKYYETLTSYKIVSMDLLQLYLSYQWAMKGL